MNKVPLNGGCYLSLSQMDNICSFWEINPLTNRVRVRAPKTKEENYPDYDRKEDKTARMVAGLCNRTLPDSTDQRVRKGGERKRGERARVEEAGEVPWSEAESDEFNTSDGGSDYETNNEHEAEFPSKFKKPTDPGKRYKSTAEKFDKIGRKRKRSTRQLDRASRAEGKRDKRDNANSAIGNSKADGYTISSNDLRNWRSAIHDADNRRSGQSRRNPNTEIASAWEDSASEDEPVGRKRRKRGVSIPRNSGRTESVIVDNPAYRYRRNLEHPRKKFGRVTTVRAGERKRKQRKQRSRSYESDKSSARGASESNSDDNDDDGDEDSDEPVESVSNFWDK